MSTSNRQGDLFARPRPPWTMPAAPAAPRCPEPAHRVLDGDTARAAAAKAKATASGGRRLVLEVLEANYTGQTDFDLAAATGWQQTSIGKRRGECAAAGLVEATTLRRPAPSGSPAIVWRITSKGIEALRGQSV